VQDSIARSACSLLLAVLLFFFDALARTLLIGFVAVILAIAFNAVVVRIPLSRGWSTLIVALGTLGAMAAAIWFGVSLLADQVRGLIEDMPGAARVDGGVGGVARGRTGLDLELIGPYLRHPASAWSAASTAPACSPARSAWSSCSPC
jgi:predicted PurR-regulated permease PerM